MSDFSSFIAENMAIVAAALYVLGMFLKAAPRIPDWAIPFILTVLGIAAGVTIYWGTDIPQGVIQGVLCAGAAVLVNQMIKQIQDARGIDTGEK